MTEKQYFDKDEFLEEGISKRTLSKAQEKNLSEDAKALVEAGFYDEELELSSRKHFINYFLLPKFESEYAELARTMLAEGEKAEKEAEKKKTK